MTFEIHSKKYGVHVVEIDDEDAEKVFQYKWCVHYKYKYGHYRLTDVRTNIIKNGKRKQIALHKLLVSFEIVDHIDRNVLNNRKENLRDCSNAENLRNKGLQSNNTSGFKGVYWNKNRNKFQAQIKYNGKNFYLGLYDTLKEGAAAYDRAAVELYGDFAKLNFEKVS